MTTQPENSKPVKPRSKPQRFVRVVHRESNGIVIAITTKTANTIKAECYIVLPILGCTFGAGYTVEKEDGTAYNVNLNSRESSCDCRGHTAHGHCKHVDALAGLAKAGQLPTLPVNDDADDFPTDADMEWMEARHNFESGLAVSPF